MMASMQSAVGWGRRCLAGMLLAVFLGAGCTMAAAAVVDRTIAVVNGHLLTWSDLDLQMRFEALENAKALSELTAENRQSAFEHLVQARVLRDQMQGIVPATKEEIDGRIAAIREEWNAMGSRASSEAGWNATLAQYGILPEELRALLAEQIEILRFTEFQVRPLVRVSRQEIEEYYHSVLVPKVEEHGAVAEPLEKVRRSIRRLLAEQKMNQEMNKWLKALRSQSTVRLLWDGVH
jgi:hypothetical protein